ncbi:MAG: hypothetical protein ACJ73J_12175 [Actinomycetes bacterium]
MNLDTRARRAADGVRASTGGVDPMVQIRELRREDQTRRRTSRTVAVVAGTVAVAGVGWLALSQLGSDGAEPQPMSPPDVVATTPDPDASSVKLAPGQTVGTGVQPPLVAKAPESWAVWKDGAFVWLDADGSQSTMTHVAISGPILEVFDPEQRTGVPIPPGGYAEWLRENPTLDVIDDRMVLVDGQRWPQLTIGMADDAHGAQFRLGRTSHNPLPREEWPDYNRDEVVTETVIEVRGKTMVVSAVGTPFDSAGQDELEKGLALVLSTMKLPN